MNRRHFLQILTSSAVAAYAFDPEKLLWTPGEKTIFIPPARSLIYASEVHSTELNVVMGIIKELYGPDNLLYKVDIGPQYIDHGRKFNNLQIYYGYDKEKK